MAILEKEVWVTLTNNVKHFEDMGYSIPRSKDKQGRIRIPRGSKILVKVKDLPNGSNAKLTKICDTPDCGQHIPNQTYNEIIKQREEGDGEDRCFKCGNDKRIKKKNEEFLNKRIGQFNENKFGSKMIVERYNGSDDIWVRFDSGNLVKTVWDDFIKGKVRNPYDKSVYGIAYLGEGKYKTIITDKNGKHEHDPKYSIWYDMLKRCYDEKYHKKFPTYIECSVCEEWLNYQVFAKWYDENIYECKEKLELDKDIINKGNKIYSPETCVFVPKRINYLFIKCDARRGKLPIGVHQHTETRKYVANCNNGHRKTINLGSYTTPEKAFEVYKFFKEKLIKQVAEEYKNIIPNKLYEALIKYEVEIND